MPRLKKKIEKLDLADFKPTYMCRFHPIDYFHEVGCPHMKWGKEELQDALNKAKQSNAYLIYLLTNSLGEKK